MAEYEAVSLANLGGGAANELFEKGLQQVIENIQDPNTKADAKRQVKLTMDITPGPDRKSAVVKYGVDTKLAPDAARDTYIYMGPDPDSGEYIAVENNPDQTSITDYINAKKKAEDKGDNVVDMKTKNGGE